MLSRATMMVLVSQPGLLLCASVKLDFLDSPVVGVTPLELKLWYYESFGFEQLATIFQLPWDRKCVAILFTPEQKCPLAQNKKLQPQLV